MTKFKFTITFEKEFDTKEDAEEFDETLTDDFYDGAIENLSYECEEIKDDN